MNSHSVRPGDESWPEGNADFVWRKMQAFIANFCHWRVSRLCRFATAVCAIVCSFLLVMNDANAESAPTSRGAANFYDALQVRNPIQPLAREYKDYRNINVVEEQVAKGTAEISAKGKAVREKTEKAKAAREREIDEITRTKVEADAPKSFINLHRHYQAGEIDLARESASQYVEYWVNLLFDTKQISGLILEAMIANGMIDEEQAQGAVQFQDWMSASGREKSGERIRATHDLSLKRIVPDTEAKAEVYYFFALNCQYCRDMAPDVERLRRALEQDKRVSVQALAVGNPPREWVEQFKDYADWRLPVYNGDTIAKDLHIGFLPSLVVISPSGKTSYVKTGQVTFDRMYEFVRTVQGLPTQESAAIARIKNTPIGFMERKKKGVTGLRLASGSGVVPEVAEKKVERIMPRRF
ncbi:MAG: hypothetical protein PHC51_00565 [bacterium]|nr:hypothetical protein [bacterium]